MMRTVIIADEKSRNLADVEAYFRDQQLPFRTWLIDQEPSLEVPTEWVPDVVMDLRWQPQSDGLLRRWAQQFPEALVLAATPLVLTVELQQQLASDRIARFNGLPTFFPQASVVEVVASEKMKPVCRQFFEAIGKTVEFVDDTIGFVAPRILAMIINEACFCLQEKVATADDIDLAMRLGTNYPQGPIAWGAAMGYDSVCALLDALFAYYHQERYRAALLLRRWAVNSTGRPVGGD